MREIFISIFIVMCGAFIVYSSITKDLEKKQLNEFINDSNARCDTLIKMDKELLSLSNYWRHEADSLSQVVKTR